MRADDDRDDLDPAEVQPTDNSSGTPVDLDRVQEIEDGLQPEPPPAQR